MVIVAVALCVVSLVAGGLLALRGEPKVTDADLQAAVDVALKAFSAEWDSRLFVYEVTAIAKSGTVTLSGVVDSTKHAEVVETIDAIAGVRRLNDTTLQLPDPALGPEVAGLVSIPVANLGDAPGQDQGDHMVTQARLGDPLEILREKDGWYQVRMADDGYLGWIDGRSIVRLDQAALADLTGVGQILVTSKFSDIRRSASPGSPEVLLTAVMGTLLPAAGQSETNGLVAVTLPAGETGFLKASEVRRLPSSVAVFAEQKTAEDIIALAKRYVGLPYLWGGTTSYGFDCSGYVQFLFGMNGYKLPRDADMQFTVGTPVPDRSKLEPGDLVFFSTYKAGPSHIGIYIGAGRFIHSGGSSGVAINSFDTKAPDYSEKLDKAYIGARRVLQAGQ